MKIDAELDKMNEDNNDREYLKELAPRLFSEEMDGARDLPEGYFDSVEEKVLAKIKGEAEPKPAEKVRSLINFRNLSIAAGLALLLALVSLLKEEGDPQPTASIETQLETISENSAALYLAEEYDLESIAAAVEIGGSEMTSEEKLTEDEILDYLLDTDVSESTLYESL